MISLDANILVYAADRAAGVRHVAAAQLVQSASNAGGALTEQSLFEFFHASVRKAKLSAAAAATVVRDLMGSFTVLYSHLGVLQDSLTLQARYGLSIWDSRLLAVCSAHGCDHLLSEDMQDGAIYDRIMVLNPFRSTNATRIRRLLT